jgi:hypothetical protein
LLLKSAENFGGEITVEMEKVSKLYEHYLRKLGNIHIAPLKPLEEIFLLNAITDKTEAQINRLINLNPIKGHLEQAEFIRRQAQAKEIPVRVDDIEQKSNQFSDVDTVVSILEHPPNRKHTILRPSIAPFFLNAYKLVRNELRGQKRQEEEIYKRLTLLPSMPGGDWKIELGRVFKMMQRGASPEEWTLIKILEAVSEHPELFKDHQTRFTTS